MNGEPDKMIAMVDQLVKELNKAEHSGTKFHGMVDPRDGDGIVYMKRRDAEALLVYYQGQRTLPSLDDRHRLAAARELTYAAGFPLRDRYGYAVSDEDVRFVLEHIKTAADKASAGDAIGIAGALGDVSLASGYDMPTTEEYEAGIVEALWDLAKK